MQKMIAICGITCTGCPAFIATKGNDDEQKKKIAESWTTEELKLQPEDINCDGCIVVGGRLINFCSACDVRRCGFEKNIKNCAYCDEYPCEKLDKIFGMAPEAKATLEEIKKSL